MSGGFGQLKEYVIACCCEAPNSWRRGSVAMAMIINIALVGILYLGWHLDAYPTSYFLMGAAVIAALDIVLILPYKLWRANRAEIDRLREQLRPNLKVEFDPSYPSCDAEVSFSNGTKSRCIRLRVENTGNSRVEGCEGWLTIREL